MIRRPPRSTLSSSSAASDVYKRQVAGEEALVFNKSGDLLGVGRAVLSGEEMKYFKRGTAVKVRHKV